MSDRKLRQARMLDLIRSKNGASINELKSEFGVSLVTIRKDLDDMEQNGLIIRKFGSAMPVQNKDPLEPFNIRSRLNTHEKQIIGQAAAALIAPTESVIIDAGSTTLEVVRHLPAGIPLTLITPAINLAIEACTHPNINVIIPGGGILDHQTLSLEGKDLEDSISRLNADKLFLGIRGLDLQRGISDTDTRRISLKQVMIQAAHQVIVVADSEKIGRASLLKIAPLDVVHTIITDAGIDPEIHLALTGLGIEVCIAG